MNTILVSQNAMLPNAQLINDLKDQNKCDGQYKSGKVRAGQATAVPLLHFLQVEMKQELSTSAPLSAGSQTALWVK